MQQTTPYYTAAHLAAALGWHPQTVRLKARSGELPEPRMIARSPRWHVEDLAKVGIDLPHLVVTAPTSTGKGGVAQ